MYPSTRHRPIPFAFHFTIFFFSFLFLSNKHSRAYLKYEFFHSNHLKEKKGILESFFILLQAKFSSNTFNIEEGSILVSTQYKIYV